MMRLLFGIVALLCMQTAFGQTAYQDKVGKHRTEKDEHFRDTASKVLNAEERSHFPGLSYFEPDTNYVIQARFKRSIGKNFEMPTTTARKPIYRRYGKLVFKLHGKKQRLFVYQPMVSLDSDSVKASYLFLPFRDSTNGKASYGGGRFLDLELSDIGKYMTVDFNYCYNPYCAYSHRYSCPITPKENTLDIGIEAGEKAYTGGNH